MGLVKNKLSFEDKHKYIDGVYSKYCAWCNEWYPCTTEFFHGNKSSKRDGLNTWCRKCAIEKATKRMYDNYDRHLLALKKNNARPETRKIKTECERNRRKEGKVLDWQKANRDKTRNYSKQRTKKNHKITPKEWDDCRIYFNFRCAYCGKTWEENKIETKKDLHKEHVDESGANNLSNCVPACMACNSNKHDFKFEKWYTEGNPVFSVQRKEKILTWLNEDYKKYIKIRKQKNEEVTK